jgi:predicted RND superfamily exporter protein
MVLSTVLILAVSLVASLGISFEGELKNLQPRHSEAFLTQEKIERHLSLSPKQMIVAVEGKDLAEIMAKGARIREKAEQYRQKGGIASFSWLGDVVNDPATQREIIDRLAGNIDGKATAERLHETLAREGFVPELFQGMTDGLAALASGAVISPEEAVERLASSPLRGMVNRYIVARDGRYHLLLYLNYRGAEFRQGSFLKDLAAIDPRARATSVDLVSAQLGETVKQSFIRGFAIGGILVIILLIVHFESLAGVCSSLFPVLAGVIVMLGAMAGFGMKLNFMNSMVLVTIIGMGSDYGLQIHNRMQGDPIGFPEAFLQSGRAVFLSAVTTVVGFGSLAFTDYGAMSSIGWATNFGVCATAFFALLVLPAFFRRV